MEFLYALQNFREATGGFFNGFFLLITQIGEAYITYLFMALIYWCGDKRVGQLIAFNVSLSGWFNQWMKKVLKIERPWIVNSKITPVEEAIEDATGYSMPAANTQRAVANFGVAGLRLPYGARRSVRYSIRVLSVIAIILVAFSGPYLGTHTLADELVALAIGLAGMVIVELLLRFVDRGGEYSLRDVLLCIFLCGLFSIPLFIFGRLSNAGTSYGLVVGWLLERRFVGFTIPKSRRIRLFRYIPGAVFIFILYRFAGKLLVYLVPEGFESFTMNLVGALFIMFLYPMVFTIWERGDRKAAAKGVAVALLLSLSIVGIVEYNAFMDYRTVNCEIIAQGGYSDVAPANTIAAYKKAVSAGADSLQIDVQLSSDGVVMCYEGVSIWQATGVTGHVYDTTAEELQAMDVAATYDGGNSGLSISALLKNYKNTQMPTLKDALRALRSSSVGLVIRLHDYEGDGSVNEGFADAVLKELELRGVEDRTTIVSDNYDYLSYIQGQNETVGLRLKTSLSNVDYLLENYPAPGYELPADRVDQDTVAYFHAMGAQVYLSDVDEPLLMNYATACGVDGITTRIVSQAEVLLNQDYAFLADNYVKTYTMPTLYDDSIASQYRNYVPQGITKVRDFILVSAYDCTKDENSIIYVINASGRLCRVLDLGFKAHVGAIAYDEENDLLWVTAARGQVYAISWQTLAATEQVDIVYKFDAGLYNHAGEHVASYMAIDRGKLYVGSYCVGKTGRMNEYDINQLLNYHNTRASMVYLVPEKVQGVTFYHAANGRKIMILTQCNGFKSSHILATAMSLGKQDYSDIPVTENIPAMVEQAYMGEDGLYLLFEASANCYRAIYSVPNDQIWVVDYHGQDL